jgi:ankyrin repeat protein
MSAQMFANVRLINKEFAQRTRPGGDLYPQQELIKQNTAAAQYRAKYGNNGKALLAAAEDGNQNAVIGLADAVNARDANGNTPLHMAAKTGNADTVNNLLIANPDIEAKADMGATPLHEAAMAGNTETVKALLSAGAKVNAPSKYGLTAVQGAAMSGNAETAEMLLKNGADANTQDMTGFSPLHSAAARGHEDVIRTLLRYDANKDLQDQGGRTAHYRAIQWDKNTPAVEKLLTGS